MGVAKVADACVAMMYVKRALMCVQRGAIAIMWQYLLQGLLFQVTGVPAAPAAPAPAAAAAATRQAQCLLLTPATYNTLFDTAVTS
jgi:hypothetical protein